MKLTREKGCTNDQVVSSSFACGFCTRVNVVTKRQKGKGSAVKENPASSCLLIPSDFALPSWIDPVGRLRCWITIPFPFGFAGASLLLEPLPRNDPLALNQDWCPPDALGQGHF